MIPRSISGSLVHEVAARLGSDWSRLRFDLIGEGSQAACYRVTSDQGLMDDESILKVFHSSDSASQFLAHEFDTLRTFFEVSRTVPEFGCPEPRAMFYRERGYLMERVHGEQLSGLVDHGALGASRITEVQHILLKALRTFHKATGEYYGDFHPDNVFVHFGDRGITVTLIDPGMANSPLYYAPAGWPNTMPLSVDLGYWAFVEHARHWRALIVRPRQAIRRIQFSRSLIAEAVKAEECDGMRKNVGEIVRWHAQRFRDEPSGRLTLVGEFAERLARLTCHLS